MVKGEVTMPIEFNSGMMYFGEPNGELTPLAEVKDFDLTCELDESIAKAPAVISKLSNQPFEFTVYLRGWEWLRMGAVLNGIFDLCPNRRVAHLADRAKKLRIRKKNLRRMFIETEAI
jgi:hypothetical protein